MIEKLIKEAADRYYASVSKEKFISDLKKAGFTVYAIERSGQTQLKGCYSSTFIYSRTDYPVSGIILNRHVSEKVEVPEWSYRIKGDFSGSGEFIFGDAA